MRKDWKGSIQLGERIGEGPTLGRWEVVASLGEGGYAEVYEVRDTFAAEAPRYALKIDTQRVKKDPRLATVRNETEKLKRLQSCDGVPRLVEGGGGRHHGRSYVVMELFAEDNLAVYQQKALLDVTVIMSIASQALQLLQSMHSSGWLHRDVKPANFVRTLDSDPADGGQWRIVDFGLAKPYISKEGEIIDAREGYNEFRGSTNYASIEAHQKKELGRRDDLWSWLYMLVELLQGHLIWRENRPPGKRASGSDDEAKKTAHRMKLRALSDPNALFATGVCPEAVAKMSRHLAGLGFKECPDYTKLQSWLAELTDADVTRSLQPRARGPSAAPAGGAQWPSQAAYQHQAAAQQWQHSNGAHQHAPGNPAYDHNSWDAILNGGAWSQDGLAMPPANGWDAHNNPLGPQELIDEAWWASSSAQQEHAASMGEDFHGQDSQLSTQMPQAPLPPHLSVPENWDQQLGQLGSEFGEEFDQAQPKAARKRSADRQLYADAGADVEAPAPKQARPSPAAPLAAPPHLLEEDHSVLLQPVITDSSSAKAGARPPWPLPGPSPRKPAGPLSAPQLGKAAWPAGQPDSGSRALPRSASANGLRPASADRSRDPDSQRSLPNGAAAQQGGQKADGMSGYGPAFLEKAIGVFEEGQVSVNGKILKKLIPGMDPAEAYVGLGWAGWALAQYTTPATQLQASQMLDHLGDFFKSLARKGAPGRAPPAAE